MSDIQISTVIGKPFNKFIQNVQFVKLVLTILVYIFFQPLSDQIVKHLVQGTSRSDRGEEFRNIIRDSSNQVNPKINYSEDSN